MSWPVLIYLLGVCLLGLGETNKTSVLPMTILEFLCSLFEKADKG
jgi:hypothetical protein